MLDRVGVVVQVGSTWCEAVDRASDVVRWANGSRLAARRGSLAVDEAGLERIDEPLRSVSHPQLFAAGACARWSGRALPKADVYAVRLAPTLAHKLRVPHGDRGACTTHRPQRQFLALPATGDGRAIASRGLFGAESAWAWRWQDRLDRRLVGRFHLAPHAMTAPASTNPPVDVSTARPGDPA